MMNFECLSNEIFHDLFEYFDPIELINAFQDLNIRFTKLLFIYFRSYHLDLRFISKSNFDLICKKYLPLIIDNISSICLSNGDETPQLYKHLINYYITIDEFTNLRSILIEKISSSNIILNITSDCFYLRNLTHLKILKSNFTKDNNPKKLIYNIWHLNNLTHCTLDINFEWIFTFYGLSIISKSIKYLSIKDYIFSSIELNRLFNLTPYLQHLSINFGESIDIKSIEILPALLITHLKLNFGGSLSTLINILKSMSNLLYFKLETDSIHLNGNQWKDILSNYLPNIKIFRFLMKILLLSSNSMEEYIKNFLNSFKTSFWINEHKWYIRCDWPKHINKMFIIYTLPYCFNNIYIIYQNRYSITTYPNIFNFNSYNQIKDIFYGRHIDNNFNLYSISYPNIHHLTLKLPINKNFYNIIPRLDYLISLKIIIKQENNNQLESQLIDLLNRSSNLNLLNIDAMLFLLLLQYNINHRSLRRIILKYNHFLNDKQCSILSNSFIGHQCEYLKISIDNRLIIIDLINKMTKLRSLNIQCKDDNLLLNENDELIQWLKDSLPNTYSISRYQSNFIRIWINR